MKTVFFVIAVISIGFLSCDGRKSKSVSLMESIEEFNQNQSNLETVGYYPKEYTEVVTDTLIADKFKIRIKNYSLENEAVLFTSVENIKPNKIAYHRVFESEIVVSTSTKTIFSGLISAALFKESSKDLFWNNVTLQHAWVNQELSTSDQVKVDVSFFNPEDNSYKLYRMSIDIEGQQQINLIEENS